MVRVVRRRRAGHGRPRVRARRDRGPAARTGSAAAAGLGAAGARRLPRRAARPPCPRRSRPPASTRPHVIGIGDRLHRLHDAADPRRRHAAVRAATDFADRPHAYVKLWKHHAAQGQADRINALAAERGEAWLPRYGGLISSEWEFAKGAAAARGGPRGLRRDGPLGRGRRLDRLAALRRRTSATPAPPATRASSRTARTRPSEFLAALDPGFGGFVADKLDQPIGALGDRAGGLTAEAAAWTGLPEGIAVAVGNVDAHVTAPAAQAVEPGQMVAIMGTSTCHVMNADVLREVPGMCGVVDGGIVAGLLGLRGRPERRRRHLRLVHANRRCPRRTPRRPRPRGEHRARAPDPAGRRAAGRRARPGRARLAQRQPLGAGRPRAVRPGGRA